MNPEDKKEMTNIVCEALEQVVLPRLQNIEDNVSDIKETLDYHSDQLETLNGKFDLVRSQADNQDIKLENHEKRIDKSDEKVYILFFPHQINIKCFLEVSFFAMSGGEDANVLETSAPGEGFEFSWFESVDVTKLP